MRCKSFAYCAVLLVAAGGLACTGQIDPAAASDPGGVPWTGSGAAPGPGSGAGGGGGQPAPGDPAAKPIDPRTCAPGPAPMRRLSRLEYNNTIRDLLGDTSRPADAFPAEQGGNGFGNDANAIAFAPVLAENYFSAAERLAATATRDAAALRKVTGCDPAAGEDACARSFIRTFGARAFRRPVATDEEARVFALYQKGRAGADFTTGVRTALRFFLQAPQFLYRIEVGAAGGPAGLRRVDHYEMASRLSYLVWASMPDQALFDAAAAGRLGTAEEVLAEARRMLGDPRAREVVRAFHETGFRLVGLGSIAKEPATFPRWKPGTGALLAQETATFIDRVVWEREGTLAALLAAPYTFMNRELATYYGVAGPAGAAFEPVALDPARYAGFLTQAGPLALQSPGTHSNPVKRGVYIRERLLCDPPPSPPPTVMAKPPEPKPGVTTRASFEMVTSPALCQSCHTLMNPIGFAFEHFDAAGLWRDTEDGLAIDTSGELVGTDVAGRFSGGADLSRRLADSHSLRSCYVLSWFRFGYGRGETSVDDCTRVGLEQAFAGAGGKIMDLILALTQTNAFLYRAEVQP